MRNTKQTTIINPGTDRSAPVEKIPENIYLVTPNRAIAQQYLYAVADGKLWRKRHPQPDSPPGNWELWGVQGLPYDPVTGLPFTELKTVTAVYADGDAAVALGEDGRIYLYQIKASLVAPDFPFNWNASWGAPFKDRLDLPPQIRSCAFSRRSANSVGYLEDPLGNRMNGGTPAALIPNKRGERGSLGLIHIYVISEAGDALSYSDTGLPAGFGYQFGLPLRGRFVAKKIAASSSTVFLIGETGRMYTALREFDISGNNPMMFRYTYKKVVQQLKPGKAVPPPFCELVNLPMEPWRRQPPVDLQDKAVITHNITMVTTGWGNAARELRVQGCNRTGDYGYYHKPIYDTVWDFKMTNEKFSPDDIIDTGKPLVLGPKKDTYMSGEIIIGNTHLAANILNFNLTDSPASVEIILTSKVRVRVLLHMVDGWTMLPLQNPGRDGTPKLFWGTLEIPKEYYLAAAPDIKAVIDRLVVYHKEPFTFYVTAAADYVSVESLGKLRPRITMTFTNNRDTIPDMRFHNDYPAALDTPLNKISGLNRLPADQNSVIETALKANRALTVKLQAVKRRLLKEALIQAFSARIFYVLESFVSLIVGLRVNENAAGTFPLIKRLFKWGPPLVYKRNWILWDAYKELAAFGRIVKERMHDYAYRLDEHRRQILCRYLNGLSTQTGVYLYCRNFKKVPGIFYDLSPLADGEEQFIIRFKKLKMRVCFTRLADELRAPAASRRAVHLVRIEPLVKPELLPDNERLVYENIFKRQAPVNGKVIMDNGTRKVLKAKGLFPVKNKAYRLQ